jgi:hypothetical protein
MRALESSEQIEKLAEVYVNAGIIPKKFINEALHIAIATKYKMDAIVSWNLTHITKFKTEFEKILTSINPLSSISSMIDSCFLSSISFIFYQLNSIYFRFPLS